MFQDDIILDQEQFQKAIDDFDALSTRLKTLTETVEDMIVRLKKGFNTPAGDVFISACEKHLTSPLKDQKRVLDHISKVLREAKDSYDPVFTEYQELITAIKQIDN